MATKNQKSEARDMVRKFQENVHFQRLMECYLNFESETDDQELQAEDQEFLEATEWALYTLKKQFVMLAAYGVLARDEKHEKNVSRLAKELLAIPAKFKQPEPKQPSRPKLRVINGGKS